MEEEKKTSLFPLLILIVVLFGGFILYRNATQKKQEVTPKSAAVAPTQSPIVEVNLKEQNESSQSGVAKLSEKDGKVNVGLSLSGGEFTAAQPSHIHLGSCSELGDVLYPLNDVVDGKSETTINATFEKLSSQKPLAVNVHTSAKEVTVYTACGDL